MINSMNFNLQPSVTSTMRPAAKDNSASVGLQTSPSTDSSSQKSPLAPSSTQVSISAQGMAASLADTSQSLVSSGTSTSSASDSSAWVNTPLKIIDIDYKKGEAEGQRLVETYVAAPIRKTSNGTFILANRIASLQKVIDKTHPELSQASWDFVLKDGKLEVTGNVSASGKQWLEGKLNADPKMVQATKDVYSSTVTAYQYTAENPSLQDIGYGDHGYFDKVADQINGKINMRNLVKNELGVDALHGVFKSGTSSSVALMHIARQYLSISRTPPVLATADGTAVSSTAQGMAASQADTSQSLASSGTSTSSASDSSAWVNTPLKIIDIDYKKGEAEWQRLFETYFAAPTRKASDATFTLANRIAGLQKVIDKTHPELSQASWDFALKDGKLEVTGNVSASGKQWLEGKLNADPKMVQAVKDVYSSTVTVYQYAAENTLTQDIGSGVRGYFDKVAEQINGKITMRNLVKNELGVDALHGVFKSGTNSGGELMRIARQYLTVSSTPPVLTTADGTTSTATA